MVARVTLISSRDAARSGLAPVSGLELHAEGSNGDTSEVLPSVNRMYMIGSRNIRSENKEAVRLDVEKGEVA